MIILRNIITKVMISEKIVREWSYLLAVRSLHIYLLLTPESAKNMNKLVE